MQRADPPTSSGMTMIAALPVFVHAALAANFAPKPVAGSGTPTPGSTTPGWRLSAKPTLTKLMLAGPVSGQRRLQALSRLPVLLACAASLSVVSPQAHAGIYVCKDAHGRTLTSDQPILDCSGQHRELNKDGSTRKVHADPNASQRQNDDPEERSKRDQLRNDRRLLQAYGNEAAIENARNRTVAGLKSEILNAQQRIDLHEQRLKQAKIDPIQLQAAITSKSKLPGGKFAEDTVKGIETERALIVQKEREIILTHGRYDAELKRLREITGGGTSGGSSGGATGLVSATVPAPAAKGNAAVGAPK